VRQRFGGESHEKRYRSSLPDEQFVIRVDGRARSQHRRFVDALREGLQLKDQFPQHDIKVRAMQASNDEGTALH
jgi:hypothetical protein